MSDIVTYLVKKDFAEQNLGKTIEYSYEIYRNNFHACYIPSRLNIDDYYVCLIEFFPNLYIHEKIKILKIIELEDIFKYDVDCLAIEFFICKYKNDSKVNYSHLKVGAWFGNIEPRPATLRSRS